MSGFKKIMSGILDPRILTFRNSGGNRLVTSGSFVASQANNNNKVWTAVSLLGTFLNQFEFQEKRQIFIQKEFVWTVHRKSNDIQ